MRNYVPMYVRIHAYVCRCLHVCVCMHVELFVSMPSAYVYACVCTCVHVLHACVHAFMHCAYVYAYGHVRVCMHSCIMRTWMWVYLCAFMPACGMMRTCIKLVLTSSQGS